jgi:formylglycine-generating enzyme required for sulfatase activity
VDGSAWREGECSIAVLRGGSWSSSAWNLRSANRDGYARSGRDGIIGFRLAMTR